MNFSDLIVALSSINNDLRDQSIRAVNTALTIRNWVFGYYIVEFEQNGNDRATYGEALLSNISKKLKALRVPNSDERELRRFRDFYTTYADAFEYIRSEVKSRGLAAPELLLKNNISNSQIQIRGSVSPEFTLEEINNNNNQIQIRGTVSPEFVLSKSNYINLFNKISYSHFIELLNINDPLKRRYYEIECVKGTWSVRELRRQVGSLLFERTGLSKNKEKLLASVDSSAQTYTFPDLIRDPYIFEFLELKQQEVLHEKDLEQALLDHIMQFMLELGKGFCFEARQKRIIIDNEHHFIDLVFYNRLLHCNVLIDLKTEKFNHSHAGQLNVYLGYYKKYEMAPGDNPPVGILLCTDKDSEHVEFATAGIDEKVFVSQYLVALPDKKELAQFIRKEMHRDE